MGARQVRHHCGACPSQHNPCMHLSHPLLLRPSGCTQLMLECAVKLLSCAACCLMGCHGWGMQVRYAAVRRQTAAHAGEREVQVLDYQNTAADLLPLLASSYALIFMVRLAASCYRQHQISLQHAPLSAALH